MPRKASIALHGIAGSFKAAGILGKLSLGVRSNRLITLLKPSNYNGDALLHVVTNFRTTSRNSILLSSISIDNIPAGHHSVKLIFRTCSLFPRLGTIRGIVCKLDVQRITGARTGDHTIRLLSDIKLTSCTSHCPTRLSNNRRRHITLTHTLTAGPQILLLSRPLSTLSTGIHIRLQSRVHTLRLRARAAAVVIARSRRRTLIVTSQVTIVCGKHFRRIKAPTRVCRSPTATFMTKFIKSVGILPNILSASKATRAVNYHIPMRTTTNTTALGPNPISIFIEPRRLHLRVTGSSLGSRSTMLKAIASAMLHNTFADMVITVNSKLRLHMSLPSGSTRLFAPKYSMVIEVTSRPVLYATQEIRYITWFYLCQWGSSRQVARSTKFYREAFCTAGASPC